MDKTKKITVEKNMQAQNAPAQPPITVLIVEDDRMHRTLIAKILSDGGFATVPAENGLVALARLNSKQKFDLVIMDWDMPGLNGLETVKAMRARQVNEGAPHIPVIAFTSNRMPGDREKCLAAGMDAYLPKDVWMPRWRESLIKKLQALIAGNFDLNDFDTHPAAEGVPEETRAEFDLDSFDPGALSEARLILKHELPVAIEEYLEDAAAYIAAITEGMNSGDVKKVAKGSHPLKSNSRGFGLLAVSQLAEAINTISRKGTLEPVAPLVPQLQEAFKRAEKKLRAALKNSRY